MTIYQYHLQVADLLMYSTAIPSSRPYTCTGHASNEQSAIVHRLETTKQPTRA